MKLRRSAALFSLALVTLFFWLFWSRPKRTDMALLVPADSLAYLQVNDLPALADGIADTTAWQTLSAPAAASLGLRNSRWLTRLARWTGIGPAEAVVLSRSQLALALFQYQTGDGGTALQVNLLATLVIDTHTSQFRMRPVIERRIEEFARRHYGQPKLEHKLVDGVDFAEWSSVDGSRRIVLAFVDSVAYIGSDELPVRACIAVRNGTQPSLATNGFFTEQRDAASADRAPLFAFIPSSGLRAFLIATAPYSLGPDATRTNAAPIVASAVAKLVDGVTWSPTFIDGQVEDQVRLTLANGITQQLQSGLVAEKPPTFQSVNLIPGNTHSLTQYNLRDSATAWNDLNRAISSHVEFLLAAESPKFLASALQGYGIDDPKAFLSAVGPELSTVKLDINSPRALLIVQVLDAAALRRLVRARLGPDSTSEQIGNSELLYSRDPERGAASFVDNALLLGSVEDVRTCLQAHNKGDRMADTGAFQRARALVNVTPPSLPTITTFTNDAESSRSFVSLFSANRAPAISNSVSALNDASVRLPNRVNVTRLTQNGFEYTSRSSFGLMGTLAVMLAGGDTQ